MPVGCLQIGLQVNCFSVNLHFQLQSMIQRPQPGEYKPYFETYIRLVPEGDFMDLLAANTHEAITFFENLPAHKHDYRYAEGKWTIKQVLMHIIDVERIMAYRALVAARGDNTTPLHVMDEHLYMANSNAANRNMESLLQEFKAVRSATESLFETMTYEQSIFAADAVTYTVTARALGYIILGHMWHHMKVMENNYLG